MSSPSETARAEAVARLLAVGIPSPEADAKWLVESCTDASGMVDVALLEARTRRREAREPLQRILGSWPFRTFDVTIAAGVFVPRPETEIVAGRAIAAACAVPGGAPTVVDLCTGSGVIAIAVAVEVADVRVLATERSANAVAAARANAVDVGAVVQILQGDLADPLPEELRGHVDVLVSNPPYLPQGDVSSWEPEVRDHDPHAALVGGVDGHEIVDRILRLAPTWLAKEGIVIVEIDDRRGPDAEAVARSAGLVDVHLLQDLAGRDRAVVARRGAA